MKKIFSKKTYWMLLAALVPLWVIHFFQDDFFNWQKDNRQNEFFNRKQSEPAQVVAPDRLIRKPEMTQAAEVHEPIVLKLSLSLGQFNPHITIEARRERNEARLAQQASLDSTLNQGFFLKQANATVAVAVSTETTVAKKNERQAAERQQQLMLNIDKLTRPKIDSPRADPFVAKLPPPPPPPPPAPPPPPPVPVAPALPFTFMGRMVESDRTILFLTKQNESYSVKLNDVLERDYRVDKIDNDQVVFTYLPLNIQQTLYIGRSG